MENTKLSQEELQTIQQLQEKNRTIIMEFGEIELIKLNLERRTDNAKQFLENLREEESAFGKLLSEKYGDGTVDLTTGEFVPAE
jgi:hypothetical protein